MLRIMVIARVEVVLVVEVAVAVVVLVKCNAKFFTNLDMMHLSAIILFQLYWYYVSTSESSL